METNLSFPEITVSYKDTDTAKRAVIKSSGDSVKMLNSIYNDCMQHHEEFWVIYLNCANKVLGSACIAKGGINVAYIDTRLILQIALKTNSTRIIISHNHPGGNCYPSSYDNDVTKEIKDACHLLHIDLLDHLIITANDYYSYIEMGTL